MTLPAALRRKLGGLLLLHWDLRGQLLALAMLPVLVLAIVWGAYVIRQRANDLQAQLQERAQLLARQMAVAADYGIFSRNLATLQTLTLAVSREPAVVAATIYGVNQEVLAANRAAESLPHPQHYDLRDLINQSARHGNTPVSSSTGRWIAYLEPVRSPSLAIDDLPDSRPLAAQAVFNGYAVVEVSSEAISSELAGFGFGVFALLAGILVSSWIIVRSFSSRIDRRIQAVALAAQQIGQGRAGVRLGTSNIAIFDRLSQDLNRMAERLEQSRLELEQRVEQATVAMREQRDTAERANSAKTRFLAAASHDLRQPMHALSLLLAALKPEQSLHSRQDLLQRVEATTHAMSELLDALLDISRLDAGGVQPREETFELLPLLLRVRDTYEGLAHRKGIEFHVRPSKLWVRSDPMLLQRILGNFVSNAIRYTPSGGRVLLTSRPRGQQCLIQIRDNGPGIGAHDQQAIFEEFVQIHNPQRDRSQGLGLGLAIVQRLAQLLRHPIELRSCPGHGATFAVLVPTMDPVTRSIGTGGGEFSPAAQAGHASPANLNGYRLLLIEDDALVRESYERLLELWGCDVRSHTSAATALAQLHDLDWAPQLIISDYRLGGGVNGLELIAAVRQHFGATLPAALVTGNTEDPELRKFNDSATRVLFKPVKPAILMRALEELVYLAPHTRSDAVVD